MKGFSVCLRSEAGDWIFKGLKIWGTFILVLEVLTHVHQFVILLILVNFANLNFIYCICRYVTDGGAG